MRWRPEAPSIYLPPSGQIDLNAIGVEAGQANNSQTALNDAAVRDMIGKASGAQNAMSEYYNASSAPPPLSIVGNASATHTGQYPTAHVPGFAGSTTIGDSYLGSTSSHPAFAKLGLLRGYGDWLALEYAGGQSRIGADYSTMKIVVDTLGTVYEGMFYDDAYGTWYTGKNVKWLMTPKDSAGAMNYHLVLGKRMTFTLT